MIKEGFVVDSMGYPSDEQLEKINKLSRRILKKQEVYVFSVILCDNDIDRDFERFSSDSLEKMAELFIGKPGIYDHSMKSKDQVARIFACCVEEVEARYTASGEPYRRLKALAYMPRGARNEDTILEIDSGIKKEVSVGCAVAKRVCSVCGADIGKGGCNHRVGNHYTVKGKKSLCHVVLNEPTDAYEWSFVAVPAQKEAGVTKSFESLQYPKEQESDVLKALYTDGDTLFGEAQKKAVCTLLNRLKAYKDIAESCADNLKDEILKKTALVSPELDADTAKEIVEKLSFEGLVKYKNSLNARLDAKYPLCGQLTAGVGEKCEKNDENDRFMI